MVWARAVVANPLSWIFAAVGLGSLGQILIKMGVSTVGEINGFGAKLFSTLLNVSVLSGFIAYAVSSLLWLMVLSKRDLSFAYPMIAAGYVVVVFLSWLVFREHISLTRILGLALICAGVVVVANSGPK